MTKFQIENDQKNLIDLDTYPENSGDSSAVDSVELENYRKDTLDTS